MIGWLPVHPIPGGHTDVEQCQAPLCGALVRASEEGRREAHDVEFHAHDKPESLDAILAGLFRRFLTGDVGTQFEPYVSTSGRGQATLMLDGDIEMTEAETMLVERIMNEVL